MLIGLTDKLTRFHFMMITNYTRDIEEVFLPFNLPTFSLNDDY